MIYSSIQVSESYIFSFPFFFFSELLSYKIYKFVLCTFFLLLCCKVFNCSFIFDIGQIANSILGLNMETVHSNFQNLKVYNFALNAKVCTFAIFQNCSFF